MENVRSRYLSGFESPLPVRDPKWKCGEGAMDFDTCRDIRDTEYRGCGGVSYVNVIFPSFPAVASYCFPGNQIVLAQVGSTWGEISHTTMDASEFWWN